MEAATGTRWSCGGLFGAPILAPARLASAPHTPPWSFHQPQNCSRNGGMCLLLVATTSTFGLPPLLSLGNTQKGNGVLSSA
jgi:hypothetical protein